MRTQLPINARVWREVRNLLLDEYFFTFVAAALSTLFKALSSRKGLIFKRRETYEFGIEFVFIAMSFAVGQYSQNMKLQREHQQSFEARKTTVRAEMEKHAAITDVAALCLAQMTELEVKIEKIESTFVALQVILVSQAGMLIFLTLLIRRYGIEDESQPSLLNGVILPNALGLSSVILTLAYLFDTTP